jgi:hypothetical protein
MKVYAKCPESLDPKYSPYLTPGKMYRVIDGDDLGFSMVDDFGGERFCRWRNSSHLDCADWIRVEVDDSCVGHEMKFKVKLKELPAVVGEIGYVLCDENGNVIHGQIASTVHTAVGVMPTIDVTFNIDGDTVAFER